MKAKLCRWYEKDCVRVSSLWWKREQRECCKLAVAIRTHSAGSGDRQNNGRVKIVTGGSLFTKCEANREAWRRLSRRHCCWEQMNVFHKLATVAVCYWKSRVRQNCCKGLAGFHDVLRKFQVDNNWQDIANRKRNKLTRAILEILVLKKAVANLTYMLHTFRWSIGVCDDVNWWRKQTQNEGGKKTHDSYIVFVFHWK